MKKWGKEDLTDKIINACINVHKELGPGFLESIYHYSGPGFLGHDFMLKHMSKEAVKWKKMLSRPIHLKLSAGPSAARRKSFFG